ncbi:DNA circularization N-terminal domain-containing protein [Acetobacter cerevisiae]|uniref:DNA circularization N-terminal domain-containing protein n=1 Tax=Acetobacter cerevisiae TaxID=178900 RepID=A0ABT1ERW3_9PROT|nr:DNA circularization N-terminal domain-containing protein [Acetobacter cerevisiae]MCP1245969.1 DNA circularization N-terminal domain-containing protein [Acetobacter cerevisiae]MCP1255687.1 DNA circularization N-terminal domain-containing protein [Acetobacter cerevisiae]
MQLGGLSKLAGEFLQGSFRGVPFVVMGNGGQAGRKQAVHDYPYRDTPWVEDLGRRGRLYRITGFLCGATCYVQRDLLTTASEASGPGLLIHPTIGVIRASCMSFEWRERDGVTGVIDIQLELLEQRNLLTSLVKTALDAAVATAAIAMQVSASSDFSGKAVPAWSVGEPSITAGKAASAKWAASAASSIRSPAVMGASIATLPGNNGRYAARNNGTIDPTATVDAVWSSLSAATASLDSQIDSLQTTTSAEDLATVILTIPESLREAVTDPGTQLSVLLPLTVYSPDSSQTTAPIGAAISTLTTAVADLCRRSALAAIAQACADWQPTSSQEAEALRLQVAELLDTEALVAADSGDDATWQALRTLRVQVTQDLSERASRLPDQITITRNACLPALTLGQQVYADATRAPDLIMRADPIHPAFMPTSFEALSA